MSSMLCRFPIVHGALGWKRKDKRESSGNIELIVDDNIIEDSFTKEFLISYTVFTSTTSSDKERELIKNGTASVSVCDDDYPGRCLCVLFVPAVMIPGELLHYFSSVLHLIKSFRIYRHYEHPEKYLAVMVCDRLT